MGVSGNCPPLSNGHHMSLQQSVLQGRAPDTSDGRCPNKLSGHVHQLEKLVLSLDLQTLVACGGWCGWWSWQAPTCIQKIRTHDVREGQLRHPPSPRVKYEDSA